MGISVTTDFIRRNCVIFGRFSMETVKFGNIDFLQTIDFWPFFRVLDSFKHFRVGNSATADFVSANVSFWSISDVKRSDFNQSGTSEFERTLGSAKSERSDDQERFERERSIQDKDFRLICKCFLYLV